MSAAEDQAVRESLHVDERTRNALAIGFLVLFAFNIVAPYFFEVPNGAAGNLIVSGGKVLETLVVFVLGYYYGGNKDSTAKTNALIQASKTATVQPGETVTHSPAGSKTTVEPISPPASGDAPVTAPALEAAPVAPPEDDPDALPLDQRVSPQ